MDSMPSVVSAEQWQSERDALLVAEKEATRRLDAIAAQRRRLPMVRFDNEKYLFDTTEGPKRLLDFFDGRPQLAIYQFMDNGPDAFCPGRVGACRSLRRMKLRSPMTAGQTRASCA